MFLVTWLFDKMGYMPKVSVETTWPFPATAKKYTPHEFEVKPAAKKSLKRLSQRQRLAKRKPNYV